MKQIVVYFIGIAGSGKSYLTKAFADWLDSIKADCMRINLDPGADFVPYSAEVDVREWFTLEHIMQKYNVGPNGAQIIASDLLITLIDDIKYEVDFSQPDFILIDTPGQMEIFTLRESSKLLLEALDRKRSVMVFLFDPVVSKTPFGFLSQLFMANSAIFRLEIPQINVLSKADVLRDEEVERIVRWSSDLDYLSSFIEKKTLSVELLRTLKDSGLFRPLIPVSSLKGYGMEDIYDGIQEFFYGGEDLERILF
ncbi:MAG: ATP/GTP-binding protein [Archaeoglobaceae archaeon]|nr:ATP/GTP-binding protein [Archaeoglobaceae archaeon]MDW8118835.1 ATP/GTP-binding protein [Archaeoglobaceae archaeon]